MRVFVASKVTRFDGLKELFQEIRRIPGSKPVATPELHLTFVFLGDVDPALIDRISSRIRSVDLHRFTVRIKGISAFPSPVSAGVLYLNLDESTEIRYNHRMLDAALTGFTKENRKFVPHITVSRFRDPTNVQDLEKKYAGIQWREEIGSIFLYRSILRPEGPIYDPLEEYQLK
ncbi:MAG: RNA 2',3'-cyclic phosphodiesterase [Thermoplasmataceae archaeon]